MSTIDGYIRDILDQLPATSAERARIGADLRAHLADVMATGVSEAEAITRMGDPAEVAAEFAENLSLEPALRWWRIGAFLVDSIVALPFVASLGLLLRIDGHSPWFSLQLSLAAVCFLSGLVFVLFYAPTLESRYGQTFGQRLFGLLVVQESGRRVTFARACLRIAPLWICGPPLFFLDRAFILFTRRGQSGTDLMAQTLVVRGGDPQPPWVRWGAVGLVVVSCIVLFALVASSATSFPPDNPIYKIYRNEFVSFW